MTGGGGSGLFRQLLRRKRLDSPPTPEFAGEAGARPAGTGLRAALGAVDLTLLGVGAIVGAGIFSSVGQLAGGTAERPGAGPSLVVSFLITAAACGFAALCYAELAALAPVAGSAYTYAYVTLGEGVAWVIGWDLIIEYAIGNIYVAQSWGEYARTFARGAFGMDLPAWLATDLQTIAAHPELALGAPTLAGRPLAFNLPAAFIVALLTVLLVRGVRESARFNNVLVLFKVGLVLAFVVVGAYFVEPAHWRPFAPAGWRGVWAGASAAFFSYIGFDALSTAAEETRDPQRALPRAILASLGICTVLYVAVVVVLTGLLSGASLSTGDPLSHALRAVGLERLSTVMALGAVVAVTAVLLVFQLGQPRILLAMARDGLLPPAFARTHPRFGTPVFGTVATGLFVALGASVMTPEQVFELTNIGTLFAFVLVAVGVLVLRVREPSRARPFRCPGFPITPLAALAICLFLMLGLPLSNWVRFGVWLLAGAGVYALYGRRHSRLATADHRRRL